MADADSCLRRLVELGGGDVLFTPGQPPWVRVAGKLHPLDGESTAPKEAGESGVRVNSISPGGIATGIFGKALGLPDDKAEQTAEIVKQTLATMQPIKRAGIPDDIAYAAVFLASDKSSFINARDIVVDGGLLGGRQWSVLQERLAQMKGAFEAIE